MLYGVYYIYILFTYLAEKNKRENNIIDKLLDRLYYIWQGNLLRDFIFAPFPRYSRIHRATPVQLRETPTKIFHVKLAISSTRDPLEHSKKILCTTRATRAVSPRNNIPTRKAHGKGIRPLENDAALRPNGSNVISDRDLPEICFRAGTRSP